MREFLIPKLAGIMLISLSGCLSAFGQEAAQEYVVKSSEVPIPKGAQWGDIRRIIQPFENWTLICDENLKKKKKVCNISQIIVDRRGNQIFSWSLAATQSGEPFMLLRTPSAINKKNMLRVRFPGRDAELSFPFKGCDETVCLALMPAGPLTRQNIAQGSDVTISFTLADGKLVRITVPLKGIEAALKAIK